MPEMSDFQRTPERTRATYIAVARTPRTSALPYSRNLARAHTTYIAVRYTQARALESFVNQVGFLFLIRTGFFLSLGLFDAEKPICYDGFRWSKDHQETLSGEVSSFPS